MISDDWAGSFGCVSGDWRRPRRQQATKAGENVRMKHQVSKEKKNVLKTRVFRKVIQNRNTDQGWQRCTRLRAVRKSFCFRLKSHPSLWPLSMWLWGHRAKPSLWFVTFHPDVYRLITSTLLGLPVGYLWTRCLDRMCLHSRRVEVREVSDRTSLSAH